MNYEEYHYTKSEFIKYTLKGTGIFFSILYLFYRNLFILFLLIPFVYVYLRVQKKKLIQERKWVLTLQFKESILSLSAALNAGYSIENAFVETLSDLRFMYEEDAYIIKEFNHIIYQLQMNRTIEEALEDFAGRSHVEEISQFSQLFVTVKRTGGNIVKIIGQTGKTLSDKIEVEREINTLITAKKYETKIMCTVPLGMIGYMWICSPGFLDPMYDNLLGNTIMTIMLFIYGVAYFVANKIMEIKM